MREFHLLKEPREYQLEAFRYARSKGCSVVCLPTGTGKTLVGILFLKWLFEEGKIKGALILEPTRFLVSQVSGVYQRDAGVSPVP